MCFFFAQKYHASMRYVGAIRKELDFRTVFNILGSLTNLGSPKMQLLGIYDEYLVEPLAQVLISLGVKRGMVVYGQDKLGDRDEYLKEITQAVSIPCLRKDFTVDEYMIYEAKLLGASAVLIGETLMRLVT